MDRLPATSVTILGSLKTWLSIMSQAPWPRASSLSSRRRSGLSCRGTGPQRLLTGAALTPHLPTPCIHAQQGPGAVALLRLQAPCARGVCVLLPGHHSPGCQWSTSTCPSRRQCGQPRALTLGSIS